MKSSIKNRYLIANAYMFDLTSNGMNTIKTTKRFHVFNQLDY